MSYDFKKLGDVELLDSVPDGANAFIESNGEIRRVSGASLGGDESNVAIIRVTLPSDTLSVSALSSLSTLSPVTLSAALSNKAVATLSAEDGARDTADGEGPIVCENMTFDEASQLIKEGKHLTARLYLVYEQDDAYLNITADSTETCYIHNGDDTHAILFTIVGKEWSEISGGDLIMWLSDGTWMVQ